MKLAFQKTRELCVETCNCGLSKTDPAQHVENGTIRGRCRYTAVKYGAGSLSSCGNVSWLWPLCLALHWTPPSFRTEKIYLC